MELLATIGLIIIAIVFMVLIAIIISTAMAVDQMIGDIEDLKIDVEILKKDDDWHNLRIHNLEEKKKKGKKHEESN